MTHKHTHGRESGCKYVCESGKMKCKKIIKTETRKTGKRAHQVITKFVEWRARERRDGVKGRQSERVREIKKTRVWAVRKMGYFWNSETAIKAYVRAHAGTRTRWNVCWAKWKMHQEWVSSLAVLQIWDDFFLCVEHEFGGVCVCGVRFFFLCAWLKTSFSDNGCQKISRTHRTQVHKHTSLSH